ncbi:hypothetical protein CEXT_584651 [Caerostris extrusa]|uniref:Uncharacterized protein n=1 Tax=Caerostris extrusa TaxID=172846 RepID=A0AAV4U715_CAEEX|nr:hypothetical protein CEXT_584651 [Caerostris extrusa]
MRTCEREGSVFWPGNVMNGRVLACYCPSSCHWKYQKESIACEEAYDDWIRGWFTVWTVVMNRGTWFIGEYICQYCSNSKEINIRRSEDTFLIKGNFKKRKEKETLSGDGTSSVMVLRGIPIFVAKISMVPYLLSNRRHSPSEIMDGILLVQGCPGRYAQGSE